MLVTGNKILDALDFLKERVKALDAQFQSSLYVFEGDDPADPRDLMRELQETHGRIARLQEVQAAYNLAVTVEVQGETMTLQRVLQLIAGANRAKTLWVKAATPDAENPYAMFGHGARQRDKDNEYAQPVVSPAEAQELANAATRRALAFKQAIRSGNAREVELDVEPAVFEV